MTKKEYEKYLGSIRNDTYYILSEMDEKKKTYQEVVQDIKTNNLFPRICSADTIHKYQKKIKNAIKLENNPLLEEQKKGIYAITIDDKIVYIGKTASSFKHRFADHCRHVNNPKEDEFYIYKILREAKAKGQRVQLKPLIALEDLKLNPKYYLTQRDLAIMELALIHLYQPIGNIEGRVIDYKYLY